MKPVLLPIVFVTFLSLSAGTGMVLGSDGTKHANENKQVPFRYALGQQKFEAMCSKCHGRDLLGTDQGPPLLHGYYKPSHHGDQAFYRAILRGTPQHHWNFGDMPAVAGATAADAERIVLYVRWLQQAEGLY